MTWAIIADSSCNLRDYTPAAPNCIYAFAPLTLHVGGEEYPDDSDLDVSKLNERVHSEATASSSACPSAGEWADLFRLADNVIVVTLSSNLSGSYDSAQMGRNLVMDEYAREHSGQIMGKNIYILDSRAAGAKLEIMVRLIDRYLTMHPDAMFDEVVSYAKRLESNSQVQFSLRSFDNLVKNGRMPKLVGALASGLSIRMLGTASEQGTIKVIAPTRGDKKTMKKILEVMRSDGYRGGMTYIDHVDNSEGAEELARAIVSEWPQAEVEILPCRGLCSYYAEETGLIIGYEWNGLS